MTTIPSLREVTAAAGLSAADVAKWGESVPSPEPEFDAAAAATGGFLTRGGDLLGALPEPAGRSESERAAAEAIADALNGARDDFLAGHATELYERITNGYRKPVRLEQLVLQAAALVPGLTPTREQLAAERDRRLADKEGIELAQGLLASHVLVEPKPGRHLMETMLLPTPEAVQRLDELRETGNVDFGFAHVARRGRVGILEIRNPRHLNAEDGLTLPQTEWAVDLILLDPEIEVGVIRGGLVDHPKYAGERVFSSGINLTHLYHGRIDFLFYLIRDLGYVNKLYRGVGTPAGPVEKLWIAAVERFAIGGGCQLLHVVDHVIAGRGSRLYLPARKEGIIPGASNLRLPQVRGRPRRPAGDPVRAGVDRGRRRCGPHLRRGGRSGSG